MSQRPDRQNEQVNIHVKNRFTEEKLTQVKRINKTFMAPESIGDLNPSKDVDSIAFRVLRPTAFARILNPLSAVVTARRFPSLLNLKRGKL